MGEELRRAALGQEVQGGQVIFGVALGQGGAGPAEALGGPLQALGQGQ